MGSWTKQLRKSGKISFGIMHLQPLFLSILCINFLFHFHSSHGFSNETKHYNSSTSKYFQHSTLRFIAFGDWGTDGSDQKEDAESIGKWCEENRCDFILSTGDNFYSHGVHSADDERFQKTWADVYDHPSIADLTWLVVAGNHDHGNGADDGREWFEVEHSKLEPRWHFPDLAYSYKISTSATTIKFVGYDSESLRHDKNNPEEMLEFIDNELSDHDTDWKIIFGHHPAYSAGNYAGSGTIRDQVVPLMKKNDVDIYFTGHEHNQEHWQTKDNPRDTDHVSIGSGGYSLHGKDESKVRQMEGYGMDLQTFIEDFGFAYVVITENEISIKFVNCNLETVYEYTRL